MRVVEPGVNRESPRCTVLVGFQEHKLVLRPNGLLDATAIQLLVELVRAAHECAVEVSVDLSGVAA